MVIVQKLYILTKFSDIKLEEWDKAIQDCNEVLKYEKDNIKALLRRATAYHKRKNFEKAKIDIERCLILDPNDKKAIVYFIIYFFQFEINF